MILKLFSVYDAAAKAYGRPFFLTSTGLAFRSFTDEVNRKADDNQMAKYPSDFSLYEHGSYNDADASFELLGTPSLVARADSVLIPSS